MFNMSVAVGTWLLRPSSTMMSSTSAHPEYGCSMSEIRRRPPTPPRPALSRPFPGQPMANDVKPQLTAEQAIQCLFDQYWATISVTSSTYCKVNVVPRDGRGYLNQHSPCSIDMAREGEEVKGEWMRMWYNFFRTRRVNTLTFRTFRRRVLSPSLYRKTRLNFFFHCCTDLILSFLCVCETFGFVFLKGGSPSPVVMHYVKPLERPG